MKINCFHCFTGLIVYLSIITTISLTIIHYTPYVSIKEEKRPSGYYCLIGWIYYKGRRIVGEGHCNRTKYQIDSLRPDMEARLNYRSKQLK